MLWYRLTDFFKSRLGHLTLFTLAVIGLFFGASKFFKKRDGAREEIASQFPRLSNEGGWADEEQEGEQKIIDPDEVFEHEDPNEGYFPFRPPVLIPNEPRVVEVLPEPDEEPKGEDEFVQIAPLIKFQRSEPNLPAPDTSIRKTPRDEVPPLPQEPKLGLEAGAILYVELVAPLTSEQNEGSVLARLSRPLMRGGKTLAPKGAPLVGAIQQASQNRLFLAVDWQLQRSDGIWVPLRAQAQESSIDLQTGKYTLNDGRAGIPGLAKPKVSGKNSLWAKTVKTLAVATGRLAQDRVRTTVGDYVPGTARNVILEETSRAIENHGVPFLTGNQEATEPVIVEAGRRFYLSTLP
ncbi:MAG: hypothetical protein ACJAQT_000083 [Akkermansiaceae bacterium]|jgi:hypothetical protein